MNFPELWKDDQGDKIFLLLRFCLFKNSQKCLIVFEEISENLVKLIALKKNEDCLIYGKEDEIAAKIKYQNIIEKIFCKYIEQINNK